MKQPPTQALASPAPPRPVAPKTQSIAVEMPTLRPIMTAERTAHVVPKSIFASTFSDAPVVSASKLRPRGDPLVTQNSIPFMSPAQIAMNQWNNGESVKPVYASALTSAAPNTINDHDGVLPGAFVNAIIENATRGPRPEPEVSQTPPPARAAPKTRSKSKR